MSDPTANQPVPDPAAAPVAAPPADPAAAGAPPAADPTRELTPEYVEQLRRENAEWRTKAHTYEEAFTGYGDEDRETVLALARALQADPLAAAELMEQAVQAIRGEQAPAGAPPAPAAAPDAPPVEDVPITKAQLEEYLAAREAAATRAADEQRMIAEIRQEVKDLGYDPTDAWGLRVMQLAAFQTGGDVKVAATIVDAEKQKVIDDYVAKLAEQGGAAGVTPAGGIPSGERKIATLADAEAAMRERLARVQ